MASRKRPVDRERPKYKPAASIEEVEQQMVSRAISLAARQLDDGTASPQTINHYLKLGSTQNRMEQEKLRNENELLRARVEQLASQKNIEELYEKAIAAMGIYSGRQDSEDDDYYD